MVDTVKPAEAAQVADFLAWAVAEEAPVEIRGTATKRALGRPMGRGNRAPEHVLDLSGLTGITLYEPEELVLSARAGTPLADIRAAVAEKGQMLAFEPPCLAALWGGDAGDPAAWGTIGGMIGANLAGPRRLKIGAARDHLLGFHAVSGRGEAFASGGRVVKNVTGYDLSKLMTGAWGTLAALTDVTIKVLPAPETVATLAVAGLSDAAAVRAMSAAMGSSHEVSGAAHLPAAVAADGSATTAIRIEGFTPSVAARRDALTAILGEFGPVSALERDESQAFWAGIRDVSPQCGGRFTPESPLWRLSVTPGEGARIVAAISGALPGRALYDWAGGLVWYAPDGEQREGPDDAGHEAVRAAITAHGGGHATLVRAPEALRAAVPVFQPQPAPLARLSKRVKDSFDPRRILNPGRMYEGV